MRSTKQIFIPVGLVFLLSAVLHETPIWSYLISWLGSFLLFYLSWVPASKDERSASVSAQFMRPLYLLQLIFAGFMCCTSIFYFLDHLGYEYFEKVSALPFIENEQTHLIAKCQRLAFLAHIALVWGMLSMTAFNKEKASFKFSNSSNVYLKVSIGCYLVALAFQAIPSLFQFSIYFNNIAIFSASLIMLKGLRDRNSLFLTYGSVMFGLNFVNATLTGYKEHILVNFIVLFTLLLPYYRRLIIVLGIPTIYVLLYILPTYANIIRQQAWSGEKTATEARSEALESIFQEDSEEQIVETNWGFLTNRFSEISMFTQFVAHVPTQRDYYKWEIVQNSVEALIPRAFYPSKPVTEVVAMERVYEADVIDRRSEVSAKTRPVVDAYLSFGYVGVFGFMFALGYIMQALNNKAERWFGGYEFGCIVMFNGCFQVLWRGNNFEFMLNNIVFGLVTMWLMFMVLRKMQILVTDN